MQMSDIPMNIRRYSRKARCECTFTRVGIEWCTTKSGRRSQFAIWRGTCHCCGAPFHSTTPLTRAALERGPSTIHCPKCRAPRYRVSSAFEREAAFAARYADVQTESDAARNPPCLAPVETGALAASGRG